METTTLIILSPPWERIEVRGNVLPPRLPPPTKGGEQRKRAS
jgi:hypothetical protein